MTQQSTRWRSVDLRSPLDEIQLVAESASGTFFCIRDVTTGGTAGTFYGQGADYADVDTAAECIGTSW